MHHRWLLILVCFLAACATHVDLGDPHYAPCGSTVCVVGVRKSASLSDQWSFELMGSRHFEDVYLALASVNPQSFHELTDGWATDGKHVWCGRAEPIAKAADLRPLGGRYYAVNGNVWYGCFRTFTHDPPARTVMADSFKYFGCEVLLVGSKIFRNMHWEGRLDYVPGVDGPTFEIDSVSKVPNQLVDACAAHDARFDYSIISGQFLITGSHGGKESVTQLSCSYLRIGDAIYYKDMPVIGANAATFEILTPDDCLYPYARDRSSVFRYHMVAKGVDRATFEIIDDTFARDRNNLYTYSLGIVIIPGVDPRTFRVLKGRSKCRSNDTYYTADATHVFYGRQILPDADPKTFEIVEPEKDQAGGCAEVGNYGRDAKHVWVGSYVVSLHPASFVALPDGSHGESKKD